MKCLDIGFVPLLGRPRWSIFACITGCQCYWLTAAFSANQQVAFEALILFVLKLCIMLFQTSLFNTGVHSNTSWYYCLALLGCAAIPVQCDVILPGERVFGCVEDSSAQF